MDRCFICHNMRTIGQGNNFQRVTDETLVLKEEIMKWNCDGKLISRKVMKCERCIKELKDLEAYRKPAMSKTNI